ncbi:MAG: RHS repeat-associated core domain-containing protein, partial [Armatimonadetes bacterium]|nr:RHS repeat-associated core domain-containing protein [Armatimonadota bacterium]
MKAAGTGALVASYAYDADGMRQIATAGGVTTRFVVDELTDEIVALTDAAGTVVTKFVRDAAGALVGMAKGTAVYTYLTNAHGDVTALVDAAGAVVARWTYDAWGVPTEYNASGQQVAVGTAGNPLLFAGYFYDTETGHYYLRARYYDPRTGRFLSMDPEPGKLTDRLSQNPYIYCQNDPVNHTDRTGRRIDA